MLIESSLPLKVRCLHGVVRFAPGVPVELMEADALRLLAKAPQHVRAIEPPEPPEPPGPIPAEGVVEAAIDPGQPSPPLQSGWSITYRDKAGRLRGGCDEREAGTVHECRWDTAGWIVLLTNGDLLPLQRIVSVGKTDWEGRIVSAWTVRSHGYNGEKNHE